MAKENRNDRFVWKAGEFTISLCVSCVHKHTTGATCKAFPSGIPDAILTGEHDHHKPYKGDKNIQYKANIKS